MRTIKEAERAIGEQDRHLRELTERVADLEAKARRHNTDVQLGAPGTITQEQFFELCCDMRNTNKIRAIMMARVIFGLGLREAKDLLDRVWSTTSEVR